MKIALLLSAILSLSACTDAKMAQFTSLGNTGTISCYSGALKIYEGKSTGKISTEQGSDGWYFQEAGTNTLVRISGSCVIRN